MPQPWGLPHRINVWSETEYDTQLPVWNAHIHNFEDNAILDPDPIWDAGPFPSLPACLNEIRSLYPCLPISNIWIS